MSAVYNSYEKAQARVDVLKQRGIWPGIVRLGCSHMGCQTSSCQHYDEQRWMLTHDPGDKLPH